MASNSKNTIIYVAPSLSSFVKSDIALLSTQYRVFVNTYNWQKKFLTPFYLIHQFFFLFKHIRTTKKIVVSFGGYWSLLPAVIGKITGTKVYIILNGTDCAAIPPLHYGNLRKQPLKWFCKQSYQTATLLLPVSDSLIYTRNTYFSDNQWSFQGIRHFFPKLKTPIQVLPNGCDEDFWKPEENVSRKPKTFLSVFSASQFILKGGDRIVELAEKLKDCSFSIAGMEKPAALTSCPPNLSFLGKLPPETLKQLYSKSTFYLQLSIFEGFGCALSEAMLCQCIPIGSSVNNIPEIIGETGFIVKKRETEEIEKVIRQALAAENKEVLGKEARKRIVTRYPLKKREKKLLSLMAEN
ncbi:glycosyltransferase family 4 protein [Candidatus Sulfidibacterium hydrothermale]|uniref:glycosyltransferase family 4 protein n=1 Tax=Candidatus Sulfidibacterium hydrothermale TaxID=2875962 RepID=UPI001F0A9CDA|nr:glycosyltransferase family 4 protein [Candidatus Sulfidibacterium hydrothermale]UBM61657.1 glycosyltransferase family 4 protein [Candidatus Sulfidibacterium hydrothermale]